ncbi:MAG: hypothetical protein KJZ96_04275 [Rhodocyclaceae bacterium]|jgi:hypothetical protein|nr:hypothetical protein [Rhodocyclaceae bacterium]MCL4757542.1 hypothetical protein [Rhodocyclaceae bacterium]
MKLILNASRAALIAGLVVATATGAAIAASSPADSHKHDHAGATELQLDHGKKWAIDAPLSRAMGHIRKAVHERLEDIHTDRLAAGGYRELAATVNEEVAYMVNNCHLTPEADAQLHLIIAELLEGATTMEKPESGANPRSGAVKIIGALDNYAKFFDDSSFQPIRH